MEIVLSNFGVIKVHLESFAQTDSQALKRNELIGYSKKCVQVKYPFTSCSLSGYIAANQSYQLRNVARNT